MAQAGRPPSYLAEYQTEMATFLVGASRLFAPNARDRDASRNVAVIGGLDLHKGSRTFHLYGTTQSDGR